MQSVTERVKEALTAGQLFDLAVSMTPEEAPEFAAAYTAEIREKQQCSQEEAERIMSSNLGYFAGYYDAEVGEKIYQLYGAAHPVFGRSTPTPQQAFEMGQKAGADGH